MTGPVYNCSLNMADAEAVVRELVARVVMERGLAGPVQVRPLSSGGANFTSALFTISIGDLKMFAKSATINEKLRSAMNAEMLFKTEQFVYNELVKTYNGFLSKHKGAKPFRFPKVYASLPDLGRESVMMEDLSALGYRSPSRQDPIDWRFAAASITQLAIFHAFSFVYEKENPEEFAALVERFKFKSTKTPENEEIFRETWKKMVKGAVEVIKEEHRASVTEILTEMEGFEKFRTLGSKTVLAHGDYRASNLMFKELKDGSLDVVVIDYQTLNSGSPAADFLYFVFLGTDQQFRRAHYQDLLQLYHQELSAALAGMGLIADEEYPLEMFEDDIKQLLRPAVSVAAIMLPIVTVEEAAAPSTAADGDVAMFAVAPNQLFAERFAAIVDDCSEWGVL